MDNAMENRAENLASFAASSKLTITWRILSFQMDSYDESSQFPVTIPRKEETYASLYIQPDNDGTFEFGLGIYCKDADEMSVTFSIMNIHNSMENIKLKTTKAYGSNGRYSVSNMVNRQELETWRQQDAVHNLEFTVLCEVEFNPQDSFHQIDLLIRQSQVCNDFAELFELGLLSDCKILAGDSTFSCHQVTFLILQFPYI